MPKKAQSYVFETLVALFITTLIVSNIASVKIIHAGPFTFDAGTLLFPLAYIVSDIITEIYGFRRMRRLLYIGISMLLLMSVTFWVVQVLPAASDWSNQGAFDTILGVIWRIVFASIVALFIGDFMNSYVLAKLKIKTEGRQLWARVVGSTAIGSLIDTVIFSLIAFAGTMSGSTMLQLIATVYFIKIATEIIVSPLTLAVINRIKRTENIDTYEDPSLSFTK
jgi:uncharacterized integral membrane protein (TIGR00697 family)